jgi:hypothetical protein
MKVTGKYLKNKLKTTENLEHLLCKHEEVLNSNLIPTKKTPKV